MTQEALAWDAHSARWRALRNELEIPTRRAQRLSATPIPVVARLDWELDGIEYLGTVAWGWTTRAVLIELHDCRRQIIGAWLPATDVWRRAATGCAGISGTAPGERLAH